jgi:hypothetical protein
LVAALGLILFFVMTHRSASLHRDPVAHHLSPEARALRRAQALAINEPNAISEKAWEHAARAYRRSRWSQP